MEKNLFTVKFTSGEQFNLFYESIKQRLVLLPVQAAFKENTVISLKIIIPVINHMFFIEGTVSEKTVAPGKTGIYVDIPETIDSVIPQIDRVLEKNEFSLKKTAHEIPDIIEEEDQPLDLLESEIDALSEDLDLMPDAGSDEIDELEIYEDSFENQDDWLSFDELKQLVALEEHEIEVEIEPEQPEKPVAEKRELTPEERQQAEPVGKFIMNLTKAMLRSGYYDPSHPGSGSAKKGLHDEFSRVLGDCNELMLSIEKTRDGVNILITGVLDEPVTVRDLVGVGVAELFVPKLSEYYDRKELLSVAIKKDITPEHFDQFMDIMSDPKVDHSEFEKAGTYLTNALAEKGITEISTVFVDDMIHLELNLPGRVEMAIQRLTKDLRVMPMFKGIDTETVKKLKLQTVQDIIRPLNQPRYLNDFLVNCYIIADHVPDMDEEDIENIIIEAFPVKLLLPTSQFVFKEMEYLKQLQREQTESKVLEKRISGIKRILKLISSRVIKENAPGTQIFLTHLYTNSILQYKELPADVQYVINTRKMGDAIHQSLDSYIQNFKRSKTADDAMVYLKSFRRTVPIFIENKEWDILIAIAESLKTPRLSSLMNSGEAVHIIQKTISPQVDSDECLIDMGSADISEQLTAFVFINAIGKFVSVYQTVDSDQRNQLEELIETLGVFGVDVLCRVLINSDDKEIRKLSSESIIKKGELARRWSLETLEDKKRPWYVHRNAMMILRNVSTQQEDFESVREYLTNPDARLRDEALKLVVALRPIGDEFLVINAATDDDAKVRWRATRALGEISPISTEAVDEILNGIGSPLRTDKEEAKKQMQNITLLITALCAIPNIPDPGKVEPVIINTMKTVAGQGKGLMKMLKRVAGVEEEAGVLKAGITLLGIIGSEESETYLRKLTKSHSHLSKLIKSAMERIDQSKTVE